MTCRQRCKLEAASRECCDAFKKLDSILIHDSRILFLALKMSMESKDLKTNLESVLKNTLKSVQLKRIHNLILKFIAIHFDSFEYF
jgi:hypothetical protein